MKLIFSILIGMISFSMAQSECTDPVKMPDVQLKQVIMETLGLSGESLQCSDLQALQVLDAAERGIENLKGLEWATNLVFLNLSNNAVVGLKPLEPLINLTNLNLANNQIAGLASLSKLSNLRFLDLSGNAIKSINPLLENEGFGTGDTISLTNNCLTKSSRQIDTLLEREITVFASSQRECP